MDGDTAGSQHVFMEDVDKLIRIRYASCAWTSDVRNRINVVSAALPFLHIVFSWLFSVVKLLWLLAIV